MPNKPLIPWTASPPDSVPRAIKRILDAEDHKTAVTQREVQGDGVVALSCSHVTTVVTVNSALLVEVAPVAVQCKLAAKLTAIEDALTMCVTGRLMKRAL